VKKFADRVILILNISAAAGLLISYVAPLINPAKFFFPALFGLAYPFLLVANLVFFSYWLIRLRKEVFVSLVVVLLGWNDLNNLLPLRFKSDEIPGTEEAPLIFRVLSYNVRGFDIYHWTRDPDTKNEIFDFIHLQNPDILCFQEYYTSARKGQTQADLSRKLERIPESAVYYTTDPANRNGFGIATYSKFPIIKRSRIPFNSSFNAAMYTDLLVGHDTIRVFNIHLQSIRFQEDNYAFMDTVRLKYSSDQMREIKSIGSRLKTAFVLRAEQASVISNYIRDSPYPVLVMGDFNDTPQSFAYRKIKKGLHDAFRSAGRGFGNTYAGELPSFRIDHILYEEPMVPCQFKRIKTDYSDHYPVTTLLCLPKASVTDQ
jgi:endonuclease/exonuclease/phosphatase family metal-dependent hydrolase